MLAALGLKSVDELFADIPAAVRIPGLNLPDGLPESKVVSRTTSILRRNRTMEEMPTFLGAGLYDHFVPAAVRAITERSEFYTSYTPYQPELSQGILQALWEYQSLICEIAGMDAANTSMYDASTALGEAALMARRLNGGRAFVVPKNLSGERRAVLRSYAASAGMTIREAEYGQDDGLVSVASLRSHVDTETAGVYVESPNFFGRFEERLGEIRDAVPSVLVVGVNPLALAVTRPPGDFGADLVIGESQVLGNPVNFGGPLAGIFACRSEHIRKMPGRVIGLTKDARGHRAFCMTLQTREQHIRRERAMSNICTNETLVAIASAVFMAVLGSNGLRALALENIRRARELASRINALDGYTAPVFPGFHFNEFVVRTPKPYREVHDALLRGGIHGGLDLARWFPELGNAALFATTEVHAEADRDRLVRALGEIG